MPDRPLPEDPANGPAPSSTFHLSQEPVTSPAATSPTAATSPPAPAYEHLGELPSTYGGPSVYLVAYDPRRLFAYWDLDPAAARLAAGTVLALRVCRADSREVESRVPLEAGAVFSHPGQYLPVQRSGAGYYVELGTGGEHGMPWRTLATSARAIVPPEGLAVAQDADARFATLPFHLSFQRLTDLLRSTMHAQQGHGLTQSVARLQQASSPEPSSVSAAADTAMLEALGALSAEQRFHLEALLHGETHLSSPGAGSGSGGGQPPALFSQGGAGASEGFSFAAFPGVTAARAGGSERLSSGGFAVGGSEALLGPRVGGLSSREMARLPRSAGGGGGGGEQSLYGRLGAAGSEGRLFGTAPSSEAWRRAQTSGPAPSSGGGGSDVFGRQRAERFLRALTSSLDVLGGLFSATGAGASGGSPASSSPVSSPGKWSR